MIVFPTGVPAIDTNIEVVREDRAFETDVDAESILHMCHVSVCSLLCQDYYRFFFFIVTGLYLDPEKIEMKNYLTCKQMNIIA